MTTITSQEWTGSCALYERFLTLHLGYIHLEASITNHLPANGVVVLCHLSLDPDELASLQLVERRRGPQISLIGGSHDHVRYC